jgi:hypothetical protein
MIDLSYWSDIKYQVARQEELEKRYKRIDERRAARLKREYETAIASNDFG